MNVALHVIVMSPFKILCYANPIRLTFFGNFQERHNITTENVIFWLILDPITFGLGSIGGYILFREFVEHERLPNRDEWLPLLRQHWFALLALTVAIGYFFYRLFYVLNGQ